MHMATRLVTVEQMLVSDKKSDCWSISKFFSKIFGDVSLTLFTAKLFSTVSNVTKIL